jgi:hypothetical protein
MIHKIFAAAVIIFSVGLIGCSSEQYTQQSRRHQMMKDTLRPMTQQDVVTMTKSGVSDSLIVSMIDATDSWFRLTPQNVVDLKNAGVSDKVITVMMEQPEAQPKNTNVQRYYVYPPYYYYGGFYPYWSYPRFSIGFGFHSFHHRRFR